MWQLTIVVATGAGSGVGAGGKGLAGLAWLHKAVTDARFSPHPDGQRNVVSVPEGTPPTHNVDPPPSILFRERRTFRRYGDAPPPLVQIGGLPSDSKGRLFWPETEAMPLTYTLNPEP